MNQRQKILNAYIQANGEANLAALHSLYPGVSEMTIRRDLDALAREGRVVRVHGGVRSVHSIATLTEQHYTRRLSERKEYKEALASKAAPLIAPETSVYLDSGSTTMCLAALISECRLLVTTNDPNIALALSRLPACAIQLVGGVMHGSNRCLAGPSAEDFVSNMNFDLAFISAAGFTPQSGFTIGNPLEARLKRIAIRRSAKCIMLMDSGKFGQVFPYTFAHLADIGVFVTDDALEPDMKQFINAKGVKVL